MAVFLTMLRPFKIAKQKSKLKYIKTTTTVVIAIQVDDPKSVTL